MIIKQIACDVMEAKKELFSSGQRKWNALEQVDGFIGQFGGWSDKEKNLAHLFSFWENEAAYQSFMKSEHDRIADFAKQSESITAIDVTIVKNIYNIKSVIGFKKADVGATYIRFTNPVVKECRATHFEQMQADVWNTGMAQQQGMKAGSFAKSASVTGSYLILTQWDSKAAHHDYTMSKLNFLKEASNVNVDVSAIGGDVFTVEPSWCLSKWKRKDEAFADHSFRKSNI
ncbi:heme-degrading monooxygenase HmoA [Alkalihalobacillus xiaoxiensis]|uniref:Heme-degrading monooxygenase HmoA n=1 Tax=Shouchella xiaoxiensis TaxID=766895 RepID=A0ABS2SN47_9BACI|nr:YdbC family protein [Shouchella xiaoxiensis]MBM7836947.1 heme-degrading monooxygenase HmoA [Shouchella xiaoxiensis]